ncbi:tetratricopeptide repeat protein [Methylacidimicrobium sp. B4]|uniref:tetratricopeptide repeat protein n=1 Tax=Methylacidimicrobium sp. B4 TaxID=2796139 RepID=UPI001A908143|nr:tetratricopeptide repeat protein [Methylacidimicrobium sp. B4]QSR83918.1 tetratricopeptide repeat protein [Methylacidimicrobium sp. B4]
MTDRRAQEWMQKGNEALAVGDWAGAVAAYREAVDQDCGYFDAQHALALALYKIGAYPEAIDAALRASAQRPEEPLVWTTLSLAYQKQGRIAEAEQAALKARLYSWKQETTERERREN